MASRKITRNPWVITIAAILGICITMLITFLGARALFPDDWAPTEAKIEATRIVSSREGTLTWTLLADLSYAVEGTRYQKANFKILHRTERDDTLVQQEQWPVGKSFALYAKSNDPERISLTPDGGQESLAVAISVLTPALLTLIVFASILIKRKNRLSS